VNHRIFERTLRSLVFRGACLFECHEIINLSGFFMSQERLGLWGLLVLAISSSLNVLAKFLAKTIFGMIIIYTIEVWPLLLRFSGSTWMVHLPSVRFNRSEAPASFSTDVNSSEGVE
jgi:hypothetical protein